MATSHSSRLGTAPEEGIKAPCVAATTANITLSGEQTIDSVAVVAGDRVLVKDQSTGSENGIYDVKTGAWTRATDWNNANDVVEGMLVTDGNDSGVETQQTVYIASFTGTFTMDSTSVTFTKLFNAGAGGDATTLTDSASANQVADNALVYGGASAVGTDAYAVNLAIDPGAYTAGMRVQFKADVANTGACSLDLHSNGAKNIKLANGNDPHDGAIQASAIADLIYDGTNFILVNPFFTGGESLVTKAELDLLIGLTGLKEQGKETIWIPAAAMRPTVSAGCAILAVVETTAGSPDMQVLDFDSSTDEHAQFQVAFPKSWDKNPVTAQFFWTHAGGQTGGLDGVAFAIQGLAVSDDDGIDTAFSNPVVMTAKDGVTAEDLFVSAETSAITIQGTPDDDDICFFRVFRDVSDAGDDLDIDARLIGVKLFFTTDLGNDE